MVYSVWCMVYSVVYGCMGVWCIVYGVWVYSIWRMVYSVWCMSVWCVVYGCIVYDVWCMVYGPKDAPEKRNLSRFCQESKHDLSDN
jgi:hypothetical protein